jgi:hypothetical protein
MLACCPLVSAGGVGPVNDQGLSVRTCASCGAPVAEGASVCAYCKASLVWQGAPPMTPGRSVREAATEWSRNIIGAPRHFADLIQSVQVHDEVFHRMFTAIARRDVTEERVASNERRSQATRVDANAVDPFAVTTEELRAKSEHVTSCGTCGGSGSASCPGCGGDGRTRCHHCGGSGQERRYYKKSSRLVKCSVCRASGTVSCGTCDGGGSVTCRGCNGSGHQLAWLTYDERLRGYASIIPESPVYVAHRQLLDHRAMAPADLREFGTLISEEERGGLKHTEGMDKAFMRAQTSSLDSRLERVTYQQYLKLAIVRRDAAYEMCGTTGVLVLSGANLAGSRTPEALRPIRRRLLLWPLLVMSLAVGIGVAVSSMRGRTPYFDPTNAWMLRAYAMTMLLSALLIGGVFRAWRPGFRMGSLRPFERIVGACAVASVLGGVLVFALNRPTVTEAQRALAAGNVARARLVVDALRSTKGDAPEVLETDDAVLLAEAETLSGDDKLKVLDRVAARNGLHVVQAREAARTSRFAEIRKLIDGKYPDPVDALARIDRWWPDSWKADAEIAELRAGADDVAYMLCGDDVCRYSASALASAAAPTADRATRVSATRQALVTDLTFAEVPAEPTLVRLQRLRGLVSTSTGAAQVAESDKEVADKAGVASSLGSAERAKVAVINADAAVAAELLGPVTHQDASTDAVTVDGVQVFLAIDGTKKCRGVYMVGPKGARSLDAAPQATAHLLSQVVGHAATIRIPASKASTSRWMEGGTAVVGRWSGGALVELRVGDATP